MKSQNNRLTLRQTAKSGSNSNESGVRLTIFCVCLSVLLHCVYDLYYYLNHRKSFACDDFAPEHPFYYDNCYIPKVIYIANDVVFHLIIAFWFSSAVILFKPLANFLIKCINLSKILLTLVPASIWMLMFTGTSAYYYKYYNPSNLVAYVSIILFQIALIKVLLDYIVYKAQVEKTSRIMYWILVSVMYLAFSYYDYNIESDLTLSSNKAKIILQDPINETVSWEQIINNFNVPHDIKELMYVKEISTLVVIDNQATHMSLTYELSLVGNDLRFQRILNTIVEHHNILPHNTIFYLDQLRKPTLDKVRTNQLSILTNNTNIYYRDNKGLRNYYGHENTSYDSTRKVRIEEHQRCKRSINNITAHEYKVLDPEYPVEEHYGELEQKQHCLRKLYIRYGKQLVSTLMLDVLLSVACYVLVFAIDMKYPTNNYSVYFTLVYILIVPLVVGVPKFFDSSEDIALLLDFTSIVGKSFFHSERSLCYHFGYVASLGTHLDFCVFDFPLEFYLFLIAMAIYTFRIFIMTIFHFLSNFYSTFVIIHCCYTALTTIIGVVGMVFTYSSSFPTLVSKLAFIIKMMGVSLLFIIPYTLLFLFLRIVEYMNYTKRYAKMVVLASCLGRASVGEDPAHLIGVYIQNNIDILNGYESKYIGGKKYAKKQALRQKHDRENKELSALDEFKKRSVAVENIPLESMKADIDLIDPDDKWQEKEINFSLTASVNKVNDYPCLLNALSYYHAELAVSDDPNAPKLMKQIEEFVTKQADYIKTNNGNAKIQEIMKLSQAMKLNFLMIDRTRPGDRTLICTKMNYNKSDPNFKFILFVSNLLTYDASSLVLAKPAQWDGAVGHIFYTDSTKFVKKVIVKTDAPANNDPAPAKNPTTDKTEVVPIKTICKLCPNLVSGPNLTCGKCWTAGEKENCPGIDKSGCRRQKLKKLPTCYTCAMRVVGKNTTDEEMKRLLDNVRIPDDKLEVKKEAKNPKEGDVAVENGARKENVPFLCPICRETTIGNLLPDDTVEFIEKATKTVSKTQYGNYMMQLCPTCAKLDGKVNDDQIEEKIEDIHRRPDTDLYIQHNAAAIVKTSSVKKYVPILWFLLVIFGLIITPIFLMAQYINGKVDEQAYDMGYYSYIYDYYKQILVIVTPFTTSVTYSSIIKSIYALCSFGHNTVKLPILIFTDAFIVGLYTIWTSLIFTMSSFINLNIDNPSFNMILSNASWFIKSPILSTIISCLIQVYIMKYGLVIYGHKIISPSSKTLVGEAKLEYSIDGENYIIEGVKTVRNGVYELFDSSYENPVTVSKSGYHDQYPHAWRFLWFNARFTNNTFMRLVVQYLRCVGPIGHKNSIITQLTQESGVDMPIGHLVPWRTPLSIPADCLVYDHCGPLKAKTAWDVWTRLSGNNPFKPLFILWEDDDDSFDVTSREKFSFPNYEDRIGRNMYTWKPVAIFYNNCSRMAYMPVVQNINTKLAARKLGQMALVTHYHTFNVNISPKKPFGDIVSKECKCNGNCVEPVGTVFNPPPPVDQIRNTSGLWMEDYTAIMTHIMTQNDESAEMCLPQFLMAKVSWSKVGDLCDDYKTSLMIERKIYLELRYSATKIPRYTNHTRGIEFGTCATKGTTYLSNGYKPGKPGRTNTNMLEFDSSFYLKDIGGQRSVWTEDKKIRNAKSYQKAKDKKDYDLAELIISGICSKYKLDNSFVYCTLIAYSSNDIGGVWTEGKKNKNSKDHRKAIDRKDFDLADLIIKGICSKYKLHEKYVIHTIIAYSSEIGGRTCFGIAQEECVRSTIQCTICHKFPPRKFKWSHSVCPTCTAICENPYITKFGGEVVAPLVVNNRTQASTLSYFTQCGVSNLDYPTPIMCAEPKYKPKKQRPELRCNEDFSWQTPGYKLPKKRPNKPISAPSQIIGITPSRRATCLNLNGHDIEEQTIKVRMFAQPETGAQKNIFSQLFDFSVRYNFLGPKRSVLKPMPLFPYDFSLDSWIARELFNLGMANEYNIIKKLQRLKSVCDVLNAQVYKLEDWGTNHDRYWMSSFTPRKKKIYIEALLKYKLDMFENKPSGPTKPTLPRVFFKFFLKRELQPHTCDYTGTRTAANPRVICNPDAWTQLIMGPYMKKMTEDLHKLWNKDSPLTYFGGLVPGDAKYWIKNCVSTYHHFNPKYTVAIENDFSKFDSTYNKEAFEFIKSCYMYWGMDFNNELISHVFDEWMKPKGQFRSGLKVSGPIMNASGRSDTALMNALINGLVQISSYCMAEQDVTEVAQLNHEKVCQTLAYIKIAVLGDDSLTFYSYFSGIEKKVGDMVARFGFEARDMKVHFSPEKMVFLANRVYPVIDKNGNQDIAWGPTMRKLHKMGISESLQPNPISWLTQVTIATLITSDFVPYIGDIARKQAELLQNTKMVDVNIINEKLRYKTYLFEKPINVKATNSVDFNKYYSGYTFDWSELQNWLHVTYGANLEDYYGFLETLEDVKQPHVIFNDRVLERMICIDTGT